MLPRRHPALKAGVCRMGSDHSVGCFLLFSATRGGGGFNGSMALLLRVSLTPSKQQGRVIVTTPVFKLQLLRERYCFNWQSSLRPIYSHAAAALSQPASLFTFGELSRCDEPRCGGGCMAGRDVGVTRRGRLLVARL